MAHHIDIDDFSTEKAIVLNTNGFIIFAFAFHKSPLSLLMIRRPLLMVLTDTHPVETDILYCNLAMKVKQTVIIMEQRRLDLPFVLMFHFTF